MIVPPIFPPGFFARFTDKHPIWTVFVLLCGAAFISTTIYLLVYP